LTTRAVSGVAEVQAQLGVASSSIQTASTVQSDYQGYAKTLGSNLTTSDVAAITAQLSTYQAQLTASYSAIAKIQSLNLASFMH
jgi:flagellar hook-associated protein 3 FlgL